ncbi:MAG: leucine-rich repeat domain-containing protein [Chitinispirillales bacterium]|jgi:hypothetical protein|nr:leucine-rich repeat domain-containing protein [Chitinispirillales bacterium]
MKALMNKHAMIAVAVLLIVMYALAPRVWISGTTIVTPSRGGTLTVRLTGWGAVASFQAVGVVIEEPGMMLTYYGVWSDTECDGDFTPPWHKFRSSITRLVVKEGVTDIGPMAFADLSELKSATIPGSVAEISVKMFDKCTSLMSVTIKDGVTSIQYDAFAQCERLEFITIPNSVKKIGQGAFYKSGLTSVTIPSSVTSFSPFVFAKSIRLTSVIIEDGVPEIGTKAFSGCTSLLSIMIPNSVISIEDGAFDSCTSMLSITIPNSVTSISRSAFTNCTSLISIDVDDDNIRYRSVNGVLFNKVIDDVIRYPSNKQGAYTIPHGVVAIGNCEFLGSIGLTSVTIPSSVKWLGKGAFSGCTSIASIISLGAVPPATLITYPDENCYALDSIPSNVCLYVPQNSISSYRDSDLWGRYKCIKPISAIGGS